MDRRAAGVVCCVRALAAPRAPNQSFCQACLQSTANESKFDLCCNNEDAPCAPQLAALSVAKQPRQVRLRKTLESTGDPAVWSIRPRQRTYTHPCHPSEHPVQLSYLFASSVANLLQVNSHLGSELRWATPRYCYASSQRICAAR